MQTTGGRRKVVLSEATSLPLAVRPVVASEIWIFAIAGMALNLIFGYTGMLSFGQATFFGLAAYTAGLMMIHWQAPLLVVLAAGTGLAGLGGALMTPVRGLLPTMGIDILPFAFVVVVLGGLGSLPGAILAGLLVGVVQSLMTAIWAPGADASVFVLMTLGIIARPQGLLGQR